MSEHKQDHPRQDIIEFLCGAGTYDSLWWGDTPNDKRPTFWWRSKLRDYVAELTKENERLKSFEKLDTALHKSVDRLGDALNAKTKESEQYAQMIHDKNKELSALTEQVESYKGAILTWNEYSKKVNEELSRLREREKELVEALRARYEHLKWLKDVNTTPPSVIDEINFLQSLLSKFEVPNQS